MPNKSIPYIYWFTYYQLDSPSVRYRAKYPLDFAQEHLDIQSRLIIPGYRPKRVLNFISSYLSALLFPKKDSLIVIQRVRSNFIYANLLKLLVRMRRNQTVYDLDDADYLEHDPKVIEYFSQQCGSIAAGSPEIARHLSAFNKQVLHITSPIVDLGIVKTQRNEVFTVGWIGGFSWGHRESLFELLLPAVKAQQFTVQLTIIGLTIDTDEQEIRAYFEGCNHVKLSLPRHVDWLNERDLQQRIAQFDVGIATLSDTIIHRSKSGIKAKQYMNGGVPVLCNDLPENNQVVVDGYNGFICQTTADFASQLKHLHNLSDQEYWKLSRQARASIKQFDHAKYFADLKQLKAPRPLLRDR